MILRDIGDTRDFMAIETDRMPSQPRSCPFSLTLDKRSSWAAREVVLLVKDEIAS